ncbi:hypothetical protein CCP3SC15_2150005 [Gammaproteobacteria bacterium]
MAASQAMTKTTAAPTILVSHLLRQYTADMSPEAPPPGGWFRSHERQQAWVLRGYGYVNPPLNLVEWLDVHNSDA